MKVLERKLNEMVASFIPFEIKVYYKEEDGVRECCILYPTGLHTMLELHTMLDVTGFELVEIAHQVLTVICERYYTIRPL